MIAVNENNASHQRGSSHVWGSVWPLDWKHGISSPGSGLWAQTRANPSLLLGPQLLTHPAGLGFCHLCNCMSQFLIINLFINIYVYKCLALIQTLLLPDV